MRRALLPALSAALLAAAVAVAAVAAASPAATAQGRAAPAARPASSQLPSVSGSFGQTPTIRFPNGKPPTTLVSRVLHSGSGATVAKGDLIAVAYTGQIWRGNVFDSTFLAKFSHQTPFGTPIGEGKVVPGWDDGLVGTRVGDRVLLVIPPRWGYGSKGQSSAGIKGTDTLVFVIDVLGRWSRGATAGDRPARYSGGGISVTGSMSGQPQVSISKSAAKPRSVKSVVLVRGTGPKISTGLVVYEEYVTDWTGKALASTWVQGQQPTSSSVGTPASGVDPFAGMPVGSRVLFEEPVSQSGGPYAIVVDLLADVTSR